MRSMPPAKHRLNDIKDRYDVAVIGGGIYGAATAWEASSRGLSVVLIEANDFGSGASANSLKTIHGGLRSLQRFDFPEMREYIRERRALLRIAPHLVSPMQCMMPTYSKFSKSRFFLGAGLKVYDLISYDRNHGLDPDRCISKTRLVSAEQFAQFVPDLDYSLVTGGASWFDAQAYNSERLVLAFILSARQAGADVFNYVQKNGYTAEEGTVTGVNITDRLTGIDRQLKAKAVIDCTGSWADQDGAYKKTTQQQQRPKLLARAINLVIKRQLSTCAIGASPKVNLDENNRLLFIAPWRSGSIVGTWYYPDNNTDPNNLKISKSELSQCLEHVNSLFPSLKLGHEDVTYIHRGLQPANPVKNNQEPKLWRHSRIIASDSGPIKHGLYWVQGVKYTTARATAEALIDKVGRYLGKDLPPSSTSLIALYGGEIPGWLDFQREWIQKLTTGHSLSEVTSKRLLRNYGSNIEQVIVLCEKDKSLAELIPGTTDTIKAELVYTLNNEMVSTLSDLVLRRTDMGSMASPSKETIDYCADVAAGFFNWNTDQRNKNIEELLQSYSEWFRT